MLVLTGIVSYSSTQVLEYSSTLLLEYSNALEPTIVAIMLPYEAATWAFSKMLSFFELRILKRYQNEHLYYRSVAQYSRITYVRLLLN